MKHKLAWLFLGVIILSIGGCSGGKDYWLVYKYNSKTVPATTYQGYYSSDIGNVKDDTVETCITNGDLFDNLPAHQKCSESDSKLHKEIAKKPPLTDDDTAKIVVHLKETPQEGMECEIKQTKIMRQPFVAYVSPSEGPKLLTDESVSFCDLHLADAGGMRLDYTVKKPQSEEKELVAGEPPTTITTKSGVVNDSIEVHTLYHFRVLVGPVYSSVPDRTYTAKAHAGGTSYVASDANGNPVHAAAFLKYYWKPRDVYDTKPCFISKKNRGEAILDCLATINPIVGLGISDHPLENVYVGGSLDILPGLDIVGGVHWSSVKTLSGGFTQGQIVPNGTIIPTEDRFLPGWFLGIAVDVGVAGTWIGKATSGLFSK